MLRWVADEKHNLKENKDKKKLHETVINQPAKWSGGDYA